MLHMALSINDPEAEALVRELAVKTGETEEQALRQSLKERLQRISRTNGNRVEGEALIKRLTEIALHCAALPDVDTRTPDEILGYDENGLPS